MYKNIFSIKSWIIWGIICTSISLAQVETVPANHPVYLFLKRMHIKGVLKNFDDTILPLSKKEVEQDLRTIESNNLDLNETDRNFLIRMEQKLGILKQVPINVFDGFPSDFVNNLIIDKEKHLYSYKDSLVSLYIDPNLEFKYIYTSRYDNNSSLLDIGGTIRGSYNDWFGFYLQGTNGTQFGDRTVARLDPRVEKSYTFNHSKINFFDGTKGYARFEKGIMSLQLGRERILWGTGYINKMVLSNNPPLFDFVKFHISYKKFKYDFLHGWLVQPPVITYVDSLSENLKSKQSKYIAISRFGYKANNNLSLGLSQMIIYSNRPFEAAYLNPFLFWESAQRSMNDLDNSFLTFDLRYLPVDGIELTSAIIFDDINFSRLFKGEWAASNNGVEWQVGTMLTGPLLPENMTFALEYMQARPYIFSHPGTVESLTYTNNGYLLGADMQPNSTRISVQITYRFTGKIFTGITYSHTLHGNNVYDANGKLIKNVGGNVFNYYTWGDPYYSYLLDGKREVSDNLKLKLTCELTYGLYWNLEYNFLNDKKNVNTNSNNIFWTSLKFDFE